ncbi:hypothetical protein [Azospirillum thermophilum]|uniref:Uncharacterized protein n=1 Tax=Azospirillum thermophilum TaxID=2202148 RepID=A0A2S2CX34_9PROT|nr:hypothetical protein [Azospirillum thermophilum]AWK88975.1 hypothetical protein DEW08_23370 [Azospirillum thermophilum]
MPSSRPPQPPRYAIQKARGKGWKTLEVGEDPDQAKARFDLMVSVNPRAYFRLIRLDYNDQSDYQGMEFNWTLIELHDPTRKGARPPAARKPSAKAPRTGEKVGLPLRFYLAVILIGALVGGLAYLRYGLPAH